MTPNESDVQAGLAGVPPWKLPHFHISVFHGPDERFHSGLLLNPVGEHWEIADETGQFGPAGAVYGTNQSLNEACREALRFLRDRLGDPTYPVWGAGSPNTALAILGYERGELRWNCWPPRLVRVAESRVGPDGGPVQQTR